MKFALNCRQCIRILPLGLLQKLTVMKIHWKRKKPVTFSPLEKICNNFTRINFRLPSCYPRRILLVFFVVPVGMGALLHIFIENKTIIESCVGCVLIFQHLCWSFCFFDVCMCACFEINPHTVGLSCKNKWLYGS